MPEDDHRLIEFALGTLADGECAALRQELAGSVELRAELEAIESALESAALSLAPVMPSEGLRGRIEASLDPASPLQGFAERVARFFDLGAEQARELLASVARVSEAPWESVGSVAGATVRHLQGGPRLADAHCGLVRLEPSSQVPTHRHRGDEWMLMLQGEITDNRGRAYLPGDLVHSAADSAHSLRTGGSIPTVFAVLVHGGVDWNVSGDPDAD